MDVKRMIAREGLIIASILLLSGIFLGTSVLLPYEKPSHRYKVSINNHHYEVSASTYASPANINTDRNKIMRAVIRKHPEDFPYAEIDAISKYGFVPPDFRVEHLGINNSFMAKVKSFTFAAGLLILLICFVYLTVCFVRWVTKI